MRVGTAIHHLIERTHCLDSAKQILTPTSLSAAMEAAYRGKPIGQRAQDRATHLMEAFKSGGLLQRLCKVEVLGKEVPMLLDGGKNGPIAGWVGAIDLLYRDPITAKIIVADFKTDAVDSKHASIVAASHAEQGRIYVETVRRAMNLDYVPAFEVWFIATDERVQVGL